MRKAATWEILEEICQGLEPTDTQYEQSKTSYETVAAWLSVSDNPILKNISLYAHGLSALGTTIRPIAAMTSMSTPSAGSTTSPTRPPRRC